MGSKNKLIIGKIQIRRKNQKKTSDANSIDIMQTIKSLKRNIRP